jgi:hypothetical protein
MLQIYIEGRFSYEDFRLAHVLHTEPTLFGSCWLQEVRSATILAAKPTLMVSPMLVTQQIKNSKAHMGCLYKQHL